MTRARWYILAAVDAVVMGVFICVGVGALPFWAYLGIATTLGGVAGWLVAEAGLTDD